MPDRPQTINQSIKPSVEEYTVFAAIEQYWHEKKYFPSAEYLAKKLGSEFSIELITVILGSERAQKRFESLGIDVNAVPLAERGELKRNKTGLTAIQLAVAETILNPFDKRSHSRKLETLGVRPATFNGWRSNKTFSDYMSQRAQDMFGDAMPMAQEALIRKLMTGDTAAMKLYFEMTGKYNRQQVSTTQDFRMLVLRMIEIIQKHIKDPEMLQILADEIKLLIEPQAVLSQTTIAQGEIVYGNDSEIGT